MRDLGREVDLFRLLQEDDEPGGDIAHELDPSRPEEIRLAQDRLGSYQGVVVQHEFGIFGASDGIAAMHLIDGLDVPVVTVLHTVPLAPATAHADILRGLAELSDEIVVPSAAAKDALLDIYSIPASLVNVIPHGSHWQPAKVNSGRRNRLLTWGLLGPGKGIERVIDAIAAVDDLAPTYRVVGQTHPNVVRREGTAYRDHLLELVEEHGLEDQVVFDDGYQGEQDLQEAVNRADVVVVPYDNSEQICSGVLTEAISAGKPVIATRFPHAEELLSGGAGIVVDHDDPAGMERAVRMLLEDDIAYRRAVARARAQGRNFDWQVVAQQYLDLVDRLQESLRVG
jgi:glycosyltransferase involved in cell wall biosynthesis